LQKGLFMSRNISFLLIFLVMPSLGMTCGGKPPPDASLEDGRPDGNSPGVVVELGTGTTRFETLDEGQELILWAGPQGGHHFIVHARMQGLLPGDVTMPGTPGNTRTLFSAYDQYGAQVDLMLPPYALGYVDGDDGWYYLPSGRLLRTDETLVAPLFDNPVLIRVDAWDAMGRYGTDQTWIVAVKEPSDGDPPDAGPSDAGVEDAAFR
jgi:hypothetical protein